MIFTIPVKKNCDFARVYKNGRYYIGKYLILYVLKGNPGYNALGVSASKKVGKSVRRNRQKRLVRENYRLMESYVRNGFLFVFVIRAQSGDIPDFYIIRSEMRNLFTRAGVFDKQLWDNTQKRD